MKIYEILSKMSDSEIGMQGLNGSITSIKSTKQRGVSAVTFHTDGLAPADLVHGSDKVGIVLFIDRTAWEREMAADAARKEQA